MQQLLLMDSANTKAYKEFRSKLMHKQHNSIHTHIAVDEQTASGFGVYEKSNLAAPL